MLFALVVMAGVLLLTMVVNNRRRPSQIVNSRRRPTRWDRGSAADGSPWAFGAYGGDSGPDCGADGGGGGCDGGGGGGE
jgi:hypothetical protein